MEQFLVEKVQEKFISKEIMEMCDDIDTNVLKNFIHRYAPSHAIFYDIKIVKDKMLEFRDEFLEFYKKYDKDCLKTLAADLPPKVSFF